jgi:hypothetical protein
MVTCRHCYAPVTWAEQRRQYARLSYAEFSKEEIKRQLPLCHRCVSTLLRRAGKPLSRPQISPSLQVMREREKQERGMTAEEEYRARKRRGQGDGGRGDGGDRSVML